MDSIDIQNIEIIIPMTENQENIIDCTPIPNDKYEAEYYSYVYSRPKKAVLNCFNNVLKCFAEDEKSISFKYYTNQAWDTFDRKLRGFEFDIPYAYDDDIVRYENLESTYINFTIKKDERTVIIHSYYMKCDLYNESVNSTYGLFKNWKSKFIVENDESYKDSIKFSLNYLFLKMQEDERVSSYVNSILDVLEEVNIVLKLDEEISVEDQSKLYI